MILFEVTVCDLRMSTQIVDLKSQFATSKMDFHVFCFTCFHSVFYSF